MPETTDETPESENRAKILENKCRIFENAEAVREWERSLLKACAEKWIAGPRAAA